MWKWFENYILSSRRLRNEKLDLRSAIRIASAEIHHMNNCNSFRVHLFDCDEGNGDKNGTPVLTNAHYWNVLSPKMRLHAKLLLLMVKRHLNVWIVTTMKICALAKLYCITAASWMWKTEGKYCPFIRSAFTECSHRPIRHSRRYSLTLRHNATCSPKSSCYLSSYLTRFVHR